MKILTIGDLHGHAVLKRIDPLLYDVIVFLGDYLDSFHIGDRQILQTLREVTAFKKAFPEKVVLLWGNHEISYLYREYRASGFRSWIGEEVKQLLTFHKGLFRIAFQVRNYLWTHSGIHQDFYDRKIKPRILKTDLQIASTLERLFSEMYPPLFEVGPERGGWDYAATGGPFWIDKTRLIEKPLRGYHQIVGHTPVPTIEHYRPYKKDNDTSLVFCDCIERGDQSLYFLDTGNPEE